MGIISNNMTDWIERQCQNQGNCNINQGFLFKNIKKLSYADSCHCNHWRINKHGVSPSSKHIGFFPYNITVIKDIVTKEQWAQLLSLYNAEHKTEHSIDTLVDTPFFLMNTYILPSWFYIKLQKQLRSFLPHILKFLNYNMRHIAGTLERTNALIIACALKEGTLIAGISDAITDVREQTMFDTLRH